MKRLIEVRNKLYDSLPNGSIEPFQLIGIIKSHLTDLDRIIKELEEKEGNANISVQLSDEDTKTKTNYEIAELHYYASPTNEFDRKYKEARKKSLKLLLDKYYNQSQTKNHILVLPCEKEIEKRAYELYNDDSSKVTSPDCFIIGAKWLKSQIKHVPMELTEENGAKAALMGEFFEVEEFEDDIWEIPVSWDNIKAIHKAIINHFTNK